MRRNWMARVIRMALMMAIAFAALSALVMALWNWLAPPVFGWHRITYLQALGLLVLSKMLFGGFHGGLGRRHWPGRMRERWEQMSPEQREKFRKGLMCGCAPSESAGGAETRTTQPAGS